MQRSIRRQTVNAAVALAAASTLASLAHAGVTGGSGQEFIISTSGATALSAFTRAGDGTTFNRGPYSLGQASLVIGASTYTLDANGQRLGIALRNAPISNEPPTSADRLVYNYHEIGSINGIIDVAQAGGLLPAQSFNVTSGNPFWHMGTRLNSAPTVGSTLTNDYTWQGKQPVRIAWSDVRAEQAFSIPGTSAPGARPTAAGYGLARPAPSGTTNFQALTPVGNLEGGLTASTTRLRNQDVAVVPFTLSANPGTGLSKVTEEDAKWLQAVGRLPNGANFNSSVRDIGSGTRNQGGNNLGLDPSWAQGERDRFDANGNEKDPFNFNRNDDRPSATITYGDKTSGSSRLRPTIQFARMGVGILSSGDAGSNGRGNGGTAPLRVLAIDFDDTGEPGSAVGGFVQPTLTNVVDGKYQMWSAAQAVTVTPDGTTAATEPSKIKGDANDDGSGVGVHRKFLDNIRNSVANFGDPLTNQTPFDAIGAASFIPTAIMGVTKQFDGDVQTARTRTPAEDAALAAFQAGSTLQTNLNWSAPATHNGNLADTGTRYNIFAPGNNITTDTQALANTNANLSIDIEPRTVLAGDFNNDGARDLADVEALALAFVNPAAFLATPASGATTNNALGLPRNYNGVEVASVDSPTTNNPTGGTATGGNIPGSALTYTAGQEGLIVLSDFNGNGNVTPTTGGNGTVSTVERADVRYFLYGGAIDTTGFADRMGDGIRQGQLRKNAAIDRFNAELDDLVTDGIVSQAAADAAKFDKFDVDNNGVRNRADAQYVDRNVGKNYTDFDDVVSTYDDLVAAELDDNNEITHVDPDGPLSPGKSDFQLIREALGGQLLDGDANFSGTVDIGDFSLLAARFNTAATRWSEADFNFDGSTDIGDFSLLAANFNVGVPGSLPRGAAVPEPAALSVIGLAAAGLMARRRKA
jgi:hypothetical protein